MTNLKRSVSRKQSTPNFSKNEHFLPPDTHSIPPMRLLYPLIRTLYPRRNKLRARLSSILLTALGHLARKTLALLQIISIVIGQGLLKFLTAISLLVQDCSDNGK